MTLSSSRSLPYLIIGHGLCGALLARSLISRGVEVIVIDELHGPSSSLAAAGVMNPIMGMRFSPITRINQLFPSALSTYETLQQEWNIQVFYPLKLLRLFQREEQQRFFEEKRLKSESIAPYLLNYSTNLKPWEDHQMLKHALGAAEFKGGWLDIPLLLKRSKEKLQDNLVERASPLNDSEINYQQDSIKWNHTTFKRVIDCRGFGLSRSKHFDWLNWKAARGDILTVEMKRFPQSHLVNRGLFILPFNSHTNPNLFKVGATWDEDNLDGLPSQQGRDSLEEKLKALTDLPYTVIDHQAGVRPILKDRMPLVGPHPSVPHLYVLGAMAARASLSVPYYAEQLTNHLLDLSPLDEDVSPLRNI